MNVLSIDSSCKQVSVALKKDNQFFSLESEQKVRASQVTLKMIDELLKKNNLKCQDLNILVFNKGPASFTGTRLAASIVQAIGYSWNIPVIGVSSLALMAHIYYKTHNYSEILSIKKAYSKKIYWALYNIDQNAYEPIDGNHISEFPDIKFNESSKWHGLSDCWNEYQTGTNKLIAHHVERIDAEEEIGAKAIIEFVMSNKKLSKTFDYKDTIPDYINHDLFD